MVIATFAVALTALVFSCVAIIMFSVNDKSENTSEADAKRLDEHDKMLQDIMNQLNTAPQGNEGATPKISQIKPVGAFQISIYTDAHNVQYPGESAIDGSITTSMHTNSHANPWWCAEMSGIYHITRVVVTNNYCRQDDSHCINRSTNLRVGVMNTRPVVGQNLDLNAYTLCEEIAGPMGAQRIVSCPDGVTGRYLVVQFKITEYMHLSEVRIYGYKDQA